MRVRARASAPTDRPGIEHAADTVLLPELAKFLPQYPDVKVKIAIYYGASDIVAERKEVGLPSGEQVTKT
jgi:hypothetical protein